MPYDPNDPLRKLAGWYLWGIYWRIFSGCVLFLIMLAVIAFYGWYSVGMPLPEGYELPPWIQIRR